MFGHSNKSYWVVLSCGTAYYTVQGDSNFWLWEWQERMKTLLQSLGRTLGVGQVMAQTLKKLRIRHFQVPKTLTFKMKPSAQPFLQRDLSAWGWKVISISNAKYLTLF